MTLPVGRCPICAVPLTLQGRTWTRSRRAARIPLSPGLPAELDSQVAVTVVDLSPLGARLEHAAPLLPEQRYLLALPLSAGHRLRLAARLVWTRAHEVAAVSPPARWGYRSGVEFLAVPPPVARDLKAYLEGTAGGFPAVASRMARHGE